MVAGDGELEAGGIEVPIGFGHSVQGEVLAGVLASRSPHAQGELRSPEQTAYRLGESVYVVGVDEDSVLAVVDDFGNSADPGSDYGSRGRGCLDEASAQCFGARGVNEHRALREQRNDVVMAAEEDDAVGDTECGAEGEQLFSAARLGLARQPQVNVVEFCRYGGKGMQKQIVVFFGAEVTRAEQDAPPAGCWRRGLGYGQEGGEVNAHVDLQKFARREAVLAAEVIRYLTGDADDAVGKLPREAVSHGAQEGRLLGAIAAVTGGKEDGHAGDFCSKGSVDVGLDAVCMHNCRPDGAECACECDDEAGAESASVGEEAVGRGNGFPLRFVQDPELLVVGCGKGTMDGEHGECAAGGFEALRDADNARLRGGACRCRHVQSVPGTSQAVL